MFEVYIVIARAEYCLVRPGRGWGSDRSGGGGTPENLVSPGTRREEPQAITRQAGAQGVATQAHRCSPSILPNVSGGAEVSLPIWQVTDSLT